MIYFSYLVFIAIIFFLYFANDINLRRRDVAQARMIWFAVARKIDPGIVNDVDRLEALTREHPTPELFGAKESYLVMAQRLESCCSKHPIVAAILRVPLKEGNKK